MENKKMTEKESLDLITQMIQNTRQNLDEGSGNMFLLWGYVTLVVTLVVMAGLYFTGSYMWMWGFWAIPALGYPLSYMLLRKQQQQVTKQYSDKMVNDLWMWIGVSCMIFVFMGLVNNKMEIILPLSSLFISMGTLITGVIIRYMKFSFAAFGLGIGTQMLINGHQGLLEMAGFALVVLFALIIPGHVLNSRAKKEMYHAKERGVNL